MKRSRKTLFSHKKQPRERKSAVRYFVVPKGCCDGAEVCELVGIFKLSKLSNIIDKKGIGLCRDDGLSVLEKLSGPQIEQR